MSATVLAVQTFLTHLGRTSLFLGSILTRVFRGDFDRRQFLNQVFEVGARSAPIVMLTAFFTGAIMVLQVLAYVRSTGATSMVPSMSAIAVFSELGPALMALMFSGRIGANTAARLGTMVLTEQMDALQALAVRPLAFFVVPRFLAMVLMMPALTAAGDLFSMFGSGLFADWLLDIDITSFFQALPEAGLLDDFSIGLLKSCVFGATIAVVSCHEGLSVEKSAGGVGRAVNRTVVYSALSIYVFDYFITWLWYRSVI